MRTKKVVILAVAITTAVLFAGCKTTGSAIQGVGGVINKTGGAVKNLG